MLVFDFQVGSRRFLAVELVFQVVEGVSRVAIPAIFRMRVEFNSLGIYWPFCKFFRVLSPVAIAYTRNCCNL